MPKSNKRQNPQAHAIDTILKTGGVVRRGCEFDPSVYQGQPGISVAAAAMESFFAAGNTLDPSDPRHNRVISAMHTLGIGPTSVIAVR